MNKQFKQLIFTIALAAAVFAVAASGLNLVQLALLGSIVLLVALWSNEALPNAIVMSNGVIYINDMARYGLVLNIFGIVFIVLFAHFYWRYLI